MSNVTTVNNPATNNVSNPLCDVVEIIRRPDGILNVKFDMIMENGQISRRVARPVVHNNKLYVSMGDLASQFNDHTANVYSALTRGTNYRGSPVRAAEVEEIRRLAPTAAFVERDVVTDDMEVENLAIDADGLVHASLSFDDGIPRRYRLVVCPDDRIRTIGHVASSLGVHQSTISRRIEVGRGEGYSNPTEDRLRTEFPNSIKRCPLVVKAKPRFGHRPLVLTNKKTPTPPATKPAVAAKVATLRAALDHKDPKPAATTTPTIPQKNESTIPSITSLLGNNTNDNYIALIMTDRVVLLPVSNSAKSLLGNGPRIFSNKDEIDALVTGVRFFTV